MADLQAEIPHEIEHVFDDAQRGGGGRLGRQEQQIDIAERRQQGAAIAASGGNGHMVGQAGRRVFLDRMVEQHPHHTIGEGGEALGGFHPGHAIGFEFVAHVLLDAGHVAAESGERGLAAGPGAGLPQIGERSRQDRGGIFGRGWQRRVEHSHKCSFYARVRHPRLSRALRVNAKRDILGAGRKEGLLF